MNRLAAEEVLLTLGRRPSCGRMLAVACLQVVDSGSSGAGVCGDPFDVQKEAVVGSLFRLLLATAGAANVPDVSARLAALQGEAALSGGPLSRDELSDAAAALAEEAAARAEAAAAVTVGFIPIAGAAAAAAELAAAALQPCSSSSSPGARAGCTDACASGGHGLEGFNGPGLPCLGLGSWFAGAARRLGAALPRASDRVLFAVADGLPGADCAIMAAKRWLSGWHAEQRAWMGAVQGVDAGGLDAQVEQWARQLGPGPGLDRSADSGAPAATDPAVLEDAEGSAMAGATLDAPWLDREGRRRCLATEFVPDAGVAAGAAECLAA